MRLDYLLVKCFRVIDIKIKCRKEKMMDEDNYSLRNRNSILDYMRQSFNELDIQGEDQQMIKSNVDSIEMRSC